MLYIDFCEFFLGVGTLIDHPVTPDLPDQEGGLRHHCPVRSRGNIHTLTVSINKFHHRATKHSPKLGSGHGIPVFLHNVSHKSMMVTRADAVHALVDGMSWLARLRG